MNWHVLQWLIPVVQFLLSWTEAPRAEDNLLSLLVLKKAERVFQTTISCCTTNRKNKYWEHSCGIEDSNH